MAYDRGSPADRLRAKTVVEGECWVWNGARLPTGYGLFIWRERATNKGGRVYAHRAAWELHTGERIPDGMLVCHTCDNPPCVRPDHLFLGTPKDNIADMWAKGRGCSGDFWHQTHDGRLPRGDDHPSRKHPERVARGFQLPQTKLSDADVVAMERLFQAGMKQKDIGAWFGVNQSVVSERLAKRRAAA